MSPRRSFLLCSSSTRSVSVRPAPVGSGRHQHSKPQSRSVDGGSAGAGEAGPGRTVYDGGSAGAGEAGPGRTVADGGSAGAGRALDICGSGGVGEARPGRTADGRPWPATIRRRGTPKPERRGSPVSRSKKPSNSAAAPVRSGSPSRQSSTMTQRVPGLMSSGPRATRRRVRSRRTGLRAGGGFGTAGGRVGRVRSTGGAAGRRLPRDRLRRGSFSISVSLWSTLERIANGRERVDRLVV